MAVLPLLGIEKNYGTGLVLCFEVRILIAFSLDGVVR